MKDKAWSHSQNIELGESGKEVVAGIVTSNLQEETGVPRDTNLWVLKVVAHSQILRSRILLLIS